jgi:hypothetical protein
VIMSFLRDLARVFSRPRSLYSGISQGRAAPSWMCVLLYCLAYEVGVLWLYSSGFTPFAEPWLRLREDTYYLAEAFYILPLVVLMWILGAGVLHLISMHVFGGRGRFETVFTMTGYSLWAPWYPLIVVDCIHATPQWLYNIVLGVSMLFMLFQTALAARTEEKIGWASAVLASLVSVGSIGVILYTYIR